MNKPKTDTNSGAQPQRDLFGVETVAIPARPTRKRPAPKPVVPTPVITKAPKPQTTPGGLINTQQAAVRLGLCKSTLDKMRCKGKGPRFIKSTDRAVRYDPADLDAWVANRKHQSTAETK
ncbi:MAG: helix-turn-helix domain-containing protein [Hyphomonadaceae bacterium]|nr:helix-turn-helix domain-containing protein [Hyphomonadaceae bacterium]